MEISIMKVFLVVSMVIIYARSSSQAETFTPSFTKRSGGADWIATSKWGKRAALKVVASQDNQDSGEVYPIDLGDRNRLEGEGYSLEGEGNSLEGEGNRHSDREEGDRYDRAVFSLERLPVEMANAVENEHLKDEHQLEHEKGLQVQEVNVELGDILKKIMIIIKEPTLQKAQKQKRTSPEFERIQYIIRNLCARLRAVEDLTDWYPVFSFNNHNKITEQDYRMIQICKKMGMKRSGSRYGPRSPRGPRLSRSGYGSPRGPRSADPDTGKPTFGKMFMRM